MKRGLPYLLVMLSLLVTGGAQCNRFQFPWATALNEGPVVFQQMPTLDQLIAQVNGNTERVRQLYARSATLSIAGMPSLRASIAYQQDRNFRFRADTGITGAEMDLGSNPEVFWIWVKRTQPPAVFYARHEEFARSAARQSLPVDPLWLVEAIGLTRFSPADQHSGPTVDEKKNFVIRSQVAGSSLTKIVVLDPYRGKVLEQRLLDARGQTLASAVLSRHEFDPASQTILPKHVEIHLPAASLTMKLDINEMMVNRLEGDPAQLFTMPQPPGFPPVNVADPRFHLPPAPGNAPNNTPGPVPLTQPGAPPAYTPPYSAGRNPALSSDTSAPPSEVEEYALPAPPAGIASASSPESPLRDSKPMNFSDDAYSQPAAYNPARDVPRRIPVQ